MENPEKQLTLEQQLAEVNELAKMFQSEQYDTGRYTYVPDNDGYDHDGHSSPKGVKAETVYDYRYIHSEEEREKALAKLEEIGKTSSYKEIKQLTLKYTNPIEYYNKFGHLNEIRTEDGLKKGLVSLLKIGIGIGTILVITRGCEGIVR